MYDRIEYVGNSKSFTLDILPSRKRVTISENNPYKFTDQDSQDDKSVCYYKSMYKDGVRLIERSISEESTDKVEEVESVQVVEEVKEELKEEYVTPVIEEVQEEVPATEEKVEELSATPEEMTEYLDLNYDENQLRDMAREIGVKRVKDSWDKATTMSKIIENNPNHVINLMKNS